ncbi:MAG: TM0996/MTH895 family glutaredoxin-like protein [Bacilli bacterium]|nr:TM0996/MTH895 family glutaredoxin-like protein [Bacilli bacterium]
MKIKVLGSGCPNCKRLEKNVIQAIEEMGLDATIEKITDYADIIAHGVMSTPALVVDNNVVFYGQVPSVDKIKDYLK